MGVDELREVIRPGTTSGLNFVYLRLGPMISGGEADSRKDVVKGHAARILREPQDNPQAGCVYL